MMTPPALIRRYPFAAKPSDLNAYVEEQVAQDMKAFAMREGHIGRVPPNEPKRFGKNAGTI
jgi:hypothetical protein